MSSSPSVGRRVRVAWGVLVALLALETLLLAWVTIITLIATVRFPDYLTQNVSLAIMSACALLWVLVTLIGAVRARASWVRGSSLTIHVLLFAAGTGCLQLSIGSWQFGFTLVAAALLGFVAAIVAKPAPQAEPEIVQS